MFDRDRQADDGVARRPIRAISMTSSPLVPLTMTVSAAPSPPPPDRPPRSRLSAVKSVPVRSLSVTESAPPSAFKPAQCLERGGWAGRGVLDVCRRGGLVPTHGAGRVAGLVSARRSGSSLGRGQQFESACRARGGSLSQSCSLHAYLRRAAARRAAQGDALRCRMCQVDSVRSAAAVWRRAAAPDTGVAADGSGTAGYIEAHRTVAARVAFLPVCVSLPSGKR